MIRDLLSRVLLAPEDQPDPYIWAAVLLAHACIGAVGWVLIGWWVIPVYALFELVQAAVSRTWLIWDMLVDWTAVALGAVIIASLSPWAVLALLIVAGAGYWRRVKQPRKSD